MLVKSLCQKRSEPHTDITFILCVKALLTRLCASFHLFMLAWVFTFHSSIHSNNAGRNISACTSQQTCQTQYYLLLSYRNNNNYMASGKSPSSPQFPSFTPVLQCKCYRSHSWFLACRLQPLGSNDPFLGSAKTICI